MIALHRTLLRITCTASDCSSLKLFKSIKRCLGLKPTSFLKKCWISALLTEVLVNQQLMELMIQAFGMFKVMLAHTTTHTETHKHTTHLGMGLLLQNPGIL